MAAARRAAQGCAQRAAHHDRRPGLWRQRHVRRRHPDAGAGPDRESGAALHPVQLDRAVLADARRADHRPQPPLGGLRRDRGAVDRLPGLRLDHRSGERDHRHDPQGQRLCHVVVRQEPQHAGLPVQRVRAPSINGRRAWASTTSTASWAARPTSGRRTCSAITRRSFRGSASPATTSPPTWRTRRSRT